MTLDFTPLDFGDAITPDAPTGAWVAQSKSKVLDKSADKPYTVLLAWTLTEALTDGNENSCPAEVTHWLKFISPKQDIRASNRVKRELAEISRAFDIDLPVASAFEDMPSYLKALAATLDGITGTVYTRVAPGKDGRSWLNVNYTPPRGAYAIDGSADVDDEAPAKPAAPTVKKKKNK